MKKKYQYVSTTQLIDPITIFINEIEIHFIHKIKSTIFDYVHILIINNSYEIYKSTHIYEKDLIH